MVEPVTAGNPMSEEKWLHRMSLSHIQVELNQRGYPISQPTISRLLKKCKYSLKRNRKEKETGSQHPQRDEQFRYIGEKRELYRKEGIPTVSIDCKKKELIGDFKNPGESWCVKAEQVNAHDFLSSAKGRAVPYGIYDVNANRGYVSVGQSYDTAEFAVDVIHDWWLNEGQRQYPQAKALALLSDGGGSNSCRSRLWKKYLQERLCDELGLEVRIHHYPRGCSKWNPIEHRLFSQISINWAGKPLQSFETMLSYLNGTQTKTGLRVKSYLNDKVYAKGKKVSDEQMNSLNIQFHSTCPKWNYTIKPRNNHGKSIS